MRELAYYSSLGFSVALSIFIGLAVGIYLDRRFETSPWCTLIFLVLGIIGVTPFKLDLFTMMVASIAIGLAVMDGRPWRLLQRIMRDTN